MGIGNLFLCKIHISLDNTGKSDRMKLTYEQLFI